MRINQLLKTVIATSLLGLGACGGGGDNGGATDTVQAASFGLLKPATSDEEMAASLRQGLVNSASISNVADLFLEGDVLEGAPVALAREDFSTTNLQEAGVDEADPVKYDGDILYVLDRSTTFRTAPENIPPVIRLLRTDPSTPNTEEIAQIEFSSNHLSGGLYLFEEDSSKQLLSVGHDNGPYDWAWFAFDYYWRDQRTQITSWDVSTPETPRENWSLELDGSLLTSRRIDNILYLVTRYTPAIEGLLPYPVSEEELADNESLIDKTPLADMLPNLVRNGGEPRELLQGTDCYLPNADYEELSLPPVSGSLITVTAIDLRAPEQISSLCFNSFSSGFYASRDSLYITANGADDSTLIHKISLANGAPEYRGSGEVPGYIGTRNPAFLMSEAGADLRVVSSTWEDRFFPLPVVELEPTVSTAEEEEEEEKPDYGRHHLTVLRESDDGTRLEQVAQLPNAAQPAHIGKPGEDLYAARFLGDRAYLVTFEVIDPLYVLDLSTPETPRIAGELELPGFSTLLQPLGEDLLLGVGSDVPDDGLAITQGVKLSLFNVTNLENPVELDSEVIGKRGSYSPALDDHHSLTLLERDGGYRVAIPIQRHAELRQGDDGLNPWTWYDWSDSGLYQFEIGPATGSLVQVGSLITETRSEERQWPFYSLYGSRSVLHDEAVFFVQLPSVWSGFWGE